MSIRKTLYFRLHQLAGRQLARHYRHISHLDESGAAAAVTPDVLGRLLHHCRHGVPYYAALMRKVGDWYASDPEAYLRQLPILTKDHIRGNMEQLTSVDLQRRRWFFNTSGGSTGEPVRFIQDQEHADRSYATTLLFSRWAGREVGDPEVRLWGSERDIIKGCAGLRAWAVNTLTNTRYLNAFRMSPASMIQFAAYLNNRPPRLLIGYAQAVYELARFLQKEGLNLVPQNAIITSATTLRPFMRSLVEKVFRCPVFDRYGSREVGDIASQCFAMSGLHVAPWGAYLEIVDDHGCPLPHGVEGNILVTCLTNWAMPLIRYQIGDRGIMSPSACTCGRGGQVLERIVGKDVDMFRTKDGTMAEGGYFECLLYFRDWVRRFQVIQKDYSLIVLRIVRSGAHYDPSELDEITARTRMLMGQDCRVLFEFVEDIAPSASSKYRYTISEVQG
ncbi:MAG: phenylacetate--CoA ligase family protein [Anaerolineae bacterium]